MVLRNDLFDQMMQKLESAGMQNEPVKLIGIRDESGQADDIINDVFLHCTDGKNVFMSRGTTDPGVHAMAAHPEGAAHMCLGVHRNIWVIDTHARSVPSFAHEALCSRSDRGCQPVKYFRDRNRNFIYDSGDDIKANPDAGINMHRMSAVQELKQIGPYSEGCQCRVNSLDHVALLCDIKLVPEVAATHFIGTDKKRFWGETAGKDYWSYRFSYLLTSKADWTL